MFVLVLYLVDNLDEFDVLGYCLDIVGCGLLDCVYLYFCKFCGGDVQFMYDDQGQIKFVIFDDFCFDVLEGFVLICCIGGVGQVFIWLDMVELWLVFVLDFCFVSVFES